MLWRKGPRAQVDRKLYKKHMQEILFNYSNLHVQSGSVFDLVFNHPISAPPTFDSPKWGEIEGVKLGKLVNLWHINTTGI
jgi:tRNA uridine 5-carboxymethylaminomethyl modification enzyme